MDNTISDEKRGQTDSFSSTSSASGSYVPEFEDYLYFAALQRLEEERTSDTQADEAKDRRPQEGKSNWFTRLSDHKGKNVNIDVLNAVSPAPPTAEELERETASRALRLASWTTVFYLITTDIFGPFVAPYALSQVGWVPGTLEPFIISLFSDLYDVPGILLYFFSM